MPSHLPHPSTFAADPSAPSLPQPTQHVERHVATNEREVTGEPVHIALVGMPGSGKSTAGALVAQALGADFVDLDATIAEAAGRPLAALFAEQGETTFRAHERRHIRALLRRERPMVMACGGGTWADGAMRRELLQHTRPVLLEAPLDTLLARLEAQNERSTRPLLAGPDPRAALERLWRARNDLHALCPRQVATAERTPQAVADAVVARLDAPVEAEVMARARGELEAAMARVAVPARAQGARQRQAVGGGSVAAPPRARPAAPIDRTANPPPVSDPAVEAAKAAQAAQAARAAEAARAADMARVAQAERMAEATRVADAARAAEAVQAAEAAQAAEAQVAETERAADAADSPPEQHRDAFGAFLAQDIEAFAVPLSALSKEANGSVATPPVLSAPLPSPDDAAPTELESRGHDDNAQTLPFLQVRGQAGSYPIYLMDQAEGDAGASEAVAQGIDAHSNGTRIAIVSDTEVAARHGMALVEALQARGLAVSLHTFAAGEESKRLSTAAGLYDELADAGHGREDTLVALGGGVVTDLTGFVASTYMRGVPLVQVPTSTLAAVDACIGGKTGLNTGRGKNLVGTFCAPQAVVIATAYLRTQSQRAHLAGLVEAAKMAALLDAPLLRLMQQKAKALSDGEPALLREVIGRALAHKASIVERDEQERGERALLNYGHTLGHAIEVGEGFGRLHGEAVALGMLAEAEWAEANGHAHGVSTALAEVLEALGVPTEWRAARVDLDALGRDKKRMGDTLKLPVVTRLGEAHMVPVALDELIDFAQATMLPSVRWAR